MKPYVPWIVAAAAVLLLTRRSSGSSPITTVARAFGAGGGDAPIAPVPRTRAPQVGIAAARPGASPSVLNPNVAGPIIAPRLSAITPATGPRIDLTGDTRIHSIDPVPYGHDAVGIPIGPVISLADATNQARSAYQSAFGAPISDAQLQALASAASSAGINVSGGPIEQSAFTAFLNSPGALRAVNPTGNL